MALVASACGEDAPTAEPSPAAETAEATDATQAPETPDATDSPEATGSPEATETTGGCETPGQCEPPEEILAGARSEGELNLASAVQTPLMEEYAAIMLDRYGVQVNYTVLRTPESMERVQAEFDTGNVTLDMLPIGDPPVYTEWLADGHLDTFTVDEIPNLAALREPDDWFIDDAFVMWGGALFTLGWNEDLLPEGGAPESYCDLAEPEWEGNFGLSDSPGATLWAHYDMIRDICGADIFSRFRENGVRFLPGGAQAAELMAAGEVGAVISSLPFLMVPLIEEGAPLAWTLPAEGVSVSPRWAMIPKESPHPNAARVFLNLLLSEEGQQIAYGGDQGMAVIPPEMVPDALVPPGRVELIDTEWANRVEPEIREDLGLPTD